LVTHVSKIDGNAGLKTDDAVAAVTRLPRFEFVGGSLALDFCNSHSRAAGADRLTCAPELAAWAARAGRPLDAVPVEGDFRQFITLRDCLCRLFDAVVLDRAPRQEDLDCLAAAARPRQISALHWDKDARRIVSAPDQGRADRLLEDIAVDALSLLSGPQTARIKRCPNETCQWFFLDTSRNGKRRWCAMADCGTRAKVRDYRARQRAGLASDSSF